MNQASAVSRIRTFRTGLWHLRTGGVREWNEWRGRQHVTPVGTPASAAVESYELDVAAVPRWPVAKHPPRRDLRVGVIMDTFSAQAWGYEFEVEELLPERWTTQLQARPVDMLFVESAWAGSSGAWRYQLTGSNAPSAALQELVAHCRLNGVPTIFWNKEDPPHFDDFLDTARLFDHVFTTDERMIDRYRNALGHDRVAVLGFAAQPALHHPMRQKGLHQVRDVAFGGSYWSHKFPERQSQMHLVLGAAAEVAERRGAQFDIYSRFESDPKYRFPERFATYVRGSLPYERMLTAYRLHKVMLNVNSVVDSPTMIARRVFEILASGTPVVSTRSPAVERWFPDGEVEIVDDAEDAGLTIRALLNSPEMRDRQVHLAQRRIWRDHTFSVRAHQVLGTVGITDPVDVGMPQVSVLASTIRPQLVRGIVESAARQTGVDVQLLLLSHGFATDELELQALATRLGLRELVVLEAERSSTLGSNLNRLVEASDGDVLAKMDDDDRYGEHYLSDAVHALGYSRADLVGKQARFTYLADRDATVLQYPHREHCWTNLVGGPTMVGPSATFVETAFEDRTLGEDTAFQRAILASGGGIYSADRFNFLQMRGQRDDHTWAIGTERILANGVVHGYGPAIGHIEV